MSDTHQIIISRKHHPLTWVMFISMTIIFGLAIVGIYFMTKRPNTDSETKAKNRGFPKAKKTTSSGGPTGGPKKEEIIISPAVFSTGRLTRETPYQSSNICDPSRLFPMKDIYVEYDKEGQIPDGSKCAEYLQAP